MMQDQLPDDSPPGRYRGSGRIVAAGVVGACALGIGLGLWARPTDPNRPAAPPLAAAAPRPGLQIVMDDTPAPIGRLLEVLPAYLSLGEEEVASEPPSTPAPVDPIAPRRAASGLVKVDNTVAAEPLLAPTLQVEGPPKAIPKPKAPPAPKAEPKVEPKPDPRVAEAKVEAARLQQAKAEKAEKAKIEIAKLEKVKLEKAKAERVHAEKARLEDVRQEKARIAAISKKADRLAAARAERAREEKLAKAEQAKAVKLAKAEAERAQAAKAAKSVRLASLAKAAKAEARKLEAAAKRRIELAQAKAAKERAARARLEADRASIRIARAAPPKKVQLARNDACASPDPGEALVCADRRLGARDRQMQAAYRNAEASGVPASALHRQQARWLQARAAAAREAPWAVEDVYEARISELNDLSRDAREN